MSNATRHFLLVSVLTLIFGGSLAFAALIVAKRNAPQAQQTLVWRTAYPGNFQPVDLTKLKLTVPPTDAMVEELPDGSRRYLYIFRRPATPSLFNDSIAIFEQFNHGPPAKQSDSQMAGHHALELFTATDGFIAQRAVLIQGTIFAVTMVGESELTGDDVATFEGVCNSVTVRPASGS